MSPNNKYINFSNRAKSGFRSFIVRDRYDFMPTGRNKFGPRVQLSFVVADLKRYSSRLPFDRNYLARPVGDDILIGRGCREHLRTSFRAFHTYRSFSKAIAYVALHLEYVERGEYGWFRCCSSGSIAQSDLLSSEGSGLIRLIQAFREARRMLEHTESRSLHEQQIVPYFVT